MSTTAGRSSEPRHGILQGARRELVAVQEATLARDLVLLIARVLVGWVFMYHGAGKLFDFKHQGGIAGATAFFQLEGVPAAHFCAYLVGITEFCGGLLLVLGLLAPLAGIALVIDMVVAIIVSTASVGMLPKAVGGATAAGSSDIPVLGRVDDAIDEVEQDVIERPPSRACNGSSRSSAT